MQKKRKNKPIKVKIMMKLKFPMMMMKIKKRRKEKQLKKDKLNGFLLMIIRLFGSDKRMRSVMRSTKISISP